MPGTITNDTTDLTVRIKDWVDANFMKPDGKPNMSQAAEALGVSRPRLTNWYAGASNPDIQKDPALHKRLCVALTLSYSRVAELAGITVSDEVPQPDEATISGDSPRSPQAQTGATHLAEVFALRPDPAHTDRFVQPTLQVAS